MKKILVLGLMLLAPVAFAKKENFKVDAGSSKISWEGQKSIKSLGSHHGTLQAKSGSLQLESGKLVGGEIVIDMKSLKDEDLTDESMNRKLVNHLHSDDFFSVEKHPTSTLKITKVAPAKDGKMDITGELTIKGITPKNKPVTFPAEVHVMDGMVHATGTMTVDRTAYNIRYNSLKFFSAIGDKAIADTFTVSFELLAKK